MARKSSTANTTSYKIADSLYFVHQTVGKAAPAKPVETPTNYIIVTDCSGSMTWDLPKLRDDAKSKIAKLLKESDTLSWVWFSGKGQYGTVLEAEPVATLADLKAVHGAMDRWIKPIGLTGFKEPLEEVVRLIDRIKAKNPSASCAMWFMSDGGDNQWSRPDILKAMEAAAGKLSSTTIVEYGYYADKALLAAMAEKAGGSLIFAEDFSRYQPQFEAAMQKKPIGGKRIEVDLGSDTVGGFAYAIQGDDLLTFTTEGTKITVPEGLGQICYLSPSVVGDEGIDLASIAKHTGINKIPDSSKHKVLDLAYAALSLYGVRMKSDVVFPILRALGDVRFIEDFANCFGKQKYSEFTDATKDAALKAALRFSKGYDPNKVPRDDAFTVLDALNLIQADDHARVLLDDLKYSRIGRGRVDASAQLSDAEMEELRGLSEQLAKERDITKIKSLNERIASITDGKQEALKFVLSPSPAGNAILGLTFNEDRPNVSFKVRREGTVDLSQRITAEFKGKIPETFPTFVFRNYAVIKDGLVNIDQLPVRVSAETYGKLTSTDGCPHALDKRDAIPDADGLYTVTINLKALPVINRKSVKAISARAFFQTQYALVKAQAVQKVYNTFAKELLPERTSTGFIQQYGAPAAAWLKEQGCTDFGGFSPPKTTQAPATDFYMGKELKVSLAGLSKVPSMKELREMIAKKKVNAGGALMVDTLTEVEAFLASDIYQKAARKDAVLEAWLDGQQKAARDKCRELIFESAKATFTLIVGQIWFSEFSSLSEGSMEIPEIQVGGKPLSCKAEMRDIQIQI
jgi:hypothetical protein